MHQLLKIRGRRRVLLTLHKFQAPDPATPGISGRARGSEVMFPVL